MNLIDLLATPAYTGLSAEEQLALASVPIKTPRPNPITWTTLNGSGVWGFNEAIRDEGDAAWVTGDGTGGGGGGGATGTYGKHYGG